jgi:hypothetical protein
MTYRTVLRRVPWLWPGVAVSALGDGMSALAVTWLALEIAPASQHALWLALAVSAFTVPAVIGTFVLARPLRGVSGAQLVTWDSTLRACALGAIAVLATTGGLSIGLFVALLAASSFVSTWGSAGTYTLIADLMPERDHVPANALLTTLGQTGVLIGPVLAGVLIAWHGAGPVLAIDAASFALLALTCRFGVPRRPRTGGPPDPSRIAGFRVMLTDRRLLALMLLTFGFYALYGPIGVGLPIYVADDLHAPASRLAWYYTGFGGGAVLGGIAAGYLRTWPLWPTVSGIVVGVGAALLPLGLDAPTPVSVAGFALAGFIFAPYGALTTALFQRAATPDSRAQVLAARRTVLILSGPAGVGLGGLLVAGWGARAAMLLAAIATLLLGLLTAALTARRGSGPPVISGRAGDAVPRDRDPTRLSACTPPEPRR